jgi:hypothetical protein
VQIARSGKPDEAVAQILALQKYEDDEDDDDEGRLQRRKRGSSDGLHNGEGPPSRLVNFDRNQTLVFLNLGVVFWLVRRHGRSRRRGALRIDFAEVSQHRRNSCKDGVICGGIAQLDDFSVDRRLIFGQINSQLGNLPRQNGADQKCDDQRRKDDGQNGGSTTQTPAPQQENWRRQNKTHRNSDRNRNEYFAPDIKRRHDEYGHRESREHLERACLIGLRPGTSGRPCKKIAQLVCLRNTNSVRRARPWRG